MNQELFGCYDTAILVRSNSQELLNDLKRIYGEYYNDFCNPVYLLNFIVGETPEAYEIKDKEDEDNAYNYIQARKGVLNVYLEEYNQAKKQFAKRIFTNSFVRAFQKNGYDIIHGACVMDEDGSSLIIGDKGSGKTTTLINLISNGFTFISNDKVAVKKIDDKIITCGIPFSMGIVERDAETLHDLDVDELYSSGNKVYLKITDIPDFFNTTNSNKGILKQMLFTDYQPNIDSLQIKKVDNNLKIIGDNVLINAVSEQKQYLNKLLEVNLKDRDLNYLNHIDGYIVSQNQNTTNELLENLKKQTRNLN